MRELATERGAAVKPERGRSRWGLGLKIGALALIVGILALLLWAVLVAGQGRSLVAKVAAGEQPAAPAFSLEVLWPVVETWPPELRPAVADGRLSLDELRGYPIVVNLWASWCIPCRDEAPILNASARAHAGSVVFVGIDVQDLPGDAVDFLSEFEVPYASGRDDSAEVYRAYGLTGVPETYFLDADGRILAHFLGGLSAEGLEAGIGAITGSGGRGGQLGRGEQIAPS